MSLDIKWGNINKKSNVDEIVIKGIIKKDKFSIEEITNLIRRKEKQVFHQIKKPIFNHLWTEGCLGGETDIKKRIEKEFKNEKQPSYYEYVKDMVNNLNLNISKIEAEQLDNGDFEIGLKVEIGLVKELNNKQIKK